MAETFAGQVRRGGAGNEDAALSSQGSRPEVTIGPKVASDEAVVSPEDLTERGSRTDIWSRLISDSLDSFFAEQGGDDEDGTADSIL